MSHQFSAHLTFAGNCREAFAFYAKVIGGKVEMTMTWGEKPDGCQGLPPGCENRVMHSSLSFEGGLLMGCDDLPGQDFAGLKGCSLAINYPTVEKGKQVLEALAEGGKLTMGMQKTFWAEGFGMAEDRFGVSWMVSGGSPQAG
ncbi:MAG: VOC family protein [Candidatus Eremiobacteraeota bacterium]|nr:VOC family protein [Candidatus Eremiobacteraeota bacterium]MCW5872517.1 VOC family protein [Candidatus Eremiobacteraeota bacterium]